MLHPRWLVPSRTVATVAMISTAITRIFGTALRTAIRRSSRVPIAETVSMLVMLARRMAVVISFAMAVTPLVVNASVMIGALTIIVAVVLGSSMVRTVVLILEGIS